MSPLITIYGYLLLFWVLAMWSAGAPREYLLNRRLTSLKHLMTSARFDRHMLDSPEPL